MRKAVTWGRKRYGQQETPYRCAAGCGAKVDKPGNICFGCTMDELHGNETFGVRILTQTQPNAPVPELTGSGTERLVPKEAA